MKTGKYLLDTNIIINLLNNDVNIKESASKTNNIFTSIIVMGELYFGAQKSSRVLENMIAINNIAQEISVLDSNLETAKFYSDIRLQLAKNGTPIPENDIWIAAIALQHNLTLITKDKHFDNIDGLKKVEW